MQLVKKRLGLAPRVFALAASVCLGIAGTTQALPINHGNFAGVGVTFLGVTEDSITDPGALPLFGAPAVSGDSLDFNAISFGSTSGAGGVDLTNGSLTMGIEAHGGLFIETISLSEAGDYTLFGVGGAAAQAAVSSAVYLDILEVDGVGINPVDVQANLVFSPSNGEFDLLTDGVALGKIWNGELAIDVTQALQNANIQGRATKVLLTLSDMLAAASAPGATAFINKADLDVSVRVIPEPATLVLLGMGLSGLFVMSERRRPRRRQGAAGSLRSA